MFFEKVDVSIYLLNKNTMEFGDVSVESFVN